MIVLIVVAVICSVWLINLVYNFTVLTPEEIEEEPEPQPEPEPLGTKVLLSCEIRLPKGTYGNVGIFTVINKHDFTVYDVTLHIDYYSSFESKKTVEFYYSLIEPYGERNVTITPFVFDSEWSTRDFSPNYFALGYKR